MPARNEANSELYSRLLFSKKLGYPLYNPRLSDDHSPARRAAGVQIGDVGVVTREGAFDPIFNVLDPELNPPNLPESFQPLAKLTPEQAKDVARHAACYPASHRISNIEVRSANLSLEANLSGSGLGLPAGANAKLDYSRNSKQTAILVLPEGGSMYEHRSLHALEEHARNNALLWYTVVRGSLKRNIEFGDLYLVTQVRKAASWRRSVGQRSEGEKKMKVGVDGGVLGGLGLSLGRKHQVGPAAADDGDSASVLSTRSHPPGHKPKNEAEKLGDAGSLSSSSEPVLPENQTVFFSGFKIMLGLNARLELTGKLDDILADGSKWANVKRGAKSFWGSVMRFVLSCCCVKQLDDEGNGVNVAKNHPSDAVNAYIIDKYPEAEAAVTHDIVWADVLADGEEIPPPPYKELVERVLQKFDIIPDNKGGFSPRPQGDRTLESLARAQANRKPDSDAFPPSTTSLEEVLSTGTNRSRHTLATSFTSHSMRTTSFSQSILLDKERRSIAGSNFLRTPLESPVEEHDNHELAMGFPSQLQAGPPLTPLDGPFSVAPPDDAGSPSPPPVPPKRPISSFATSLGKRWQSAAASNPPTSAVDDWSVDQRHALGPPKLKISFLEQAENELDAPSPERISPGRSNVMRPPPTDDTESDYHSAHEANSWDILWMGGSRSADARGPHMPVYDRAMGKGDQSDQI
ncbi:hypothetical protein C8F01DRAFT_1137188 [Mycena amicta]|nr:hypothetical protein C8F01DRAFT_1137188 [Mycena amicta]